MPLRIVLTYEGSPDVFKKDFNRIKKKAMEGAAHKWHQDILPQHFTEEGAKRWRYRKRGKKYLRRKQFKKGHQKPLVFTGDLKRQAMRFFGSRPTKTKIITYMNVPSYAKINFINHTNYGEEMTAVNEKDKRELYDEFEKLMGKEMQTVRRKKTTKRF